MHPKDAEGIANSVDPIGAVCCGSALFAQICLSEILGSLRYTENRLKLTLHQMGFFFILLFNLSRSDLKSEG